jgi:hypothetical protein
LRQTCRYGGAHHERDQGELIGNPRIGVKRNGDRALLITRGGHDWTKRSSRPPLRPPQPHTIAIALHARAITIIFDFVKPLGAVGDDGRFGRRAEFKGLKHGLKIGI